MPRYFIEVAYLGTNYSGFQIQENAPTIQSEVENSFQKVLKVKPNLTGASRTDAGVHAHQNYFHFDWEADIVPKNIYNLNAVLPQDIVIKRIFKVEETAHCRFDAMLRRYRYYIYTTKNPFLFERAWYYPFPIDILKLQDCAAILLGVHDFTSFAKKNTDVNNHLCTIFKANWYQQNDTIVFEVTANRFLRGMVRGLVGTMLKVMKEENSVERFQQIIASASIEKTDFRTPACGLYLNEVKY